jgi:AcrR family transcriptional regulator
LYFKSKEALYLAALASDVRAMVAAGRKEMEKMPGLRHKLHAFLRVRMEYCRSRQEFLRIYLAEYGSLFVKTAPSRELVDLLQDNIRYVSTIIRRASRRGEIGPVPAGATAAALFDLSRGLMERRLLGWKEFRAPDEIEFSIDLLFSGIQNYAKSTAKRGKHASKREGRRAEVA